MFYRFVQTIVFAFFFLKLNASCPEGSIEWPINQNGSCFYFNSNTSGFAAAELLCAEMKGTLVSIHDGFANSLLAQEGKLHFRESTVTDFWIGLTNLMSYGNWTWIDSTVLDFNDWASGEPQSMTGNNCASLSSNDGRWRSDDCFIEKPFVCKIDAKYFDPTTTTTTQYSIYTNCSNNFTYYQPTHSCYGVGNWTDPANWTQAEEYCAAFGAHLSSIHSYDEFHFLEALHWIAQAGIWTGAFSNDGGISWKWSDGSSWDYNSWGAGYPHLKTSACGALWVEGLTDEDCSDSLRIVCRAKLK